MTFCKQIDELRDNRFFVLQAQDGLIHIWLPTDAGDGDDWHCYALNRERALNLSCRLRAICEGENARLGKRGA